jgi:putative tryptophan/tyrosine transport system substrate-binding protein
MTPADPLIVSYRTRFVDFAAKHRLLSMYPDREFADIGGLMFYGGSIAEMYRPGDLRVEQPTKFEMVINLRAMNALGMTLPRSLLMRADEVIR